MAENVQILLEADIMRTLVSLSKEVAREPSSNPLKDIRLESVKSGYVLTDLISELENQERADRCIREALRTQTGFSEFLDMPTLEPRKHFKIVSTC